MLSPIPMSPINNGCVLHMPHPPTIISSQDQTIDTPQTKHVQKVPRHRAHPTQREDINNNR